MTYGKIRREVKEDLQQRKGRGERFAITFDEWTSGHNRRYLGINLHTMEKLYSLRTIRVKEKMPAKKATEVLPTKLAQFGINLKKDILGHTTDGAVMVIKLLEIEHQTCHCHGLHLAACSVLCCGEKKMRKKWSGRKREEEQEQEEPDEEEEGDLSSIYKEIIQKVRKIVPKIVRNKIEKDCSKNCLEQN